jgi:hypothetical protein
MLLITIFALTLLANVFAVNFDWERDQLTENETLTNKAIRFGSLDATPIDGCRNIPGDEDWPSEEDWSAFNQTLGGVLLKPKPLARVCYTGPSYNPHRCSQLQQSWAGMNLQYISLSQLFIQVNYPLSLRN